MNPQEESKKARAHALAFKPAAGSMKEKASFLTREDRDAFTIEQYKQCILSDFHALSDIIGKSAARTFLFDEVIDPLPKSYELS